MKGNIKRLAVLVIITVMATFMMAATVTAGSPIDITGQYAATGSGTCLVAFGGFDEDNNMVPLGDTDLVTFTMEAVFKFYSNGYGTVARTNPTIDHTNPSLALTEDGWKFKYKVNRDGSITLTQLCEPGKPTGVYILGGPPPGGFEYYNNNRNWRGTVSPDGKTIILNGGYPDIIKNIDQSPDGNCAAIDGAPEIVCNVSAVLIWQHDIRWGWNYDLDDDHCDDHRR